MKILFDYARLLARQCEAACYAFEGKSVLDSAQRIFGEICKQLTKDFLPPIDREDIAALSFSLFEIAAKAKTYSQNVKIKETRLKEQLEALSAILQGLLNKTKTCGEDIRRLISINFKCAEAVGKSGYASSLNDSVANFLEIANTAYFKNL